MAALKSRRPDLEATAVTDWTVLSYHSLALLDPILS